MSKAGTQKGEFVGGGDGEFPRGSFTGGGVSHVGLGVRYVVGGSLGVRVAASRGENGRVISYYLRHRDHAPRFTAKTSHETVKKIISIYCIYRTVFCTYYITWYIM